MRGLAANGTAVAYYVNMKALFHPSRKIRGMKRQCSVLIVDDDDTLRATLRKIFTKAGYRTEVAEDADEAMTAFTEQSWDLVLADLKMPRKDGLSLLDDLRKIRPDALVVIMTAYGDQETRDEAMRRGAYAYLNKPVSRAELLSLCQKALEGA